MFERLRMALRLRDPWEAVDLGFILLRANWRAVILAWLAAVVPLSAILLALFRDHLWVPPLVVWWLKPALDRLVLHVLARATFGEPPSLKETLGQAPRLMRRGFLASLAWRRFSPQRSFVLPVWQLEEQPSAGYRRRCAVLLRRSRPQAVWLTFVCLLFQGAICVGALAAISLFTPAAVDFGVTAAVFGSGPERARWLDLLMSLLPIAAFTLLEPFYVAGGFALYLNRRVELEGWDLEVAFRKMAARIARALGRSAALLLLAFALFAPSPLRAHPDPKAVLAEVLKDPEFQVTRKKKGLHWKQARTEASPATRRSLPDLSGPLKLLAVFAKWALVAGGAALAAWLLWRNRGALSRRLRAESAWAPPDILFGMDIRPESLPPGLDAVAAGLWAEGRAREALALLYRGALAHLAHRCRASISRGATEGDCLRKAEAVLPAPALDYFRRLTLAWLSLAYAGLPPGPGAEALCAEWAAHFQPPAPEDGR